MKSNNDIRYPLPVILQATAQHFNVKNNTIFSKTRLRENVNMRYIFYAAAKSLNGPTVSLATIGHHAKRYRGKSFDHSTVLYGINKAKEYMETEKEFRENYKAIKRRVKETCLPFKQDKDDFEDYKISIAESVLNCEDKESLKNLLETVMKN